MLRKEAKKGYSLFGRFVGAVIIFETGAFVATYIFWSRLNQSREVREKLNNSAPWALNLYYNFGEMISDENKAIRLADYKAWAAKAKSSQQR